MTKKPLNILVFPCGSEIGLEIYNSLKWSSFINLFGASSASDHGEYVYKNYIGNLPMVESEDFITRLNKVIDKYKIDFIFPAHDSVVLKLAENQSAIGCQVITSPVETCKICRSKKQTYETLKSVVRVPRVYNSKKKDLKFPLFLKPEVGQGSKGIFKALNAKDVEFYLEKDLTLLLLEYLPGREFTVDCLTDRYGQLSVIAPRERLRVINGISVKSKPISDKRVIDIASKINQKLKFRGAWFFQLKESADNELVLMEVAPRIAGTMGLTRVRGINLALLSIFDRLNLDINIINNHYKIEIDRALISRYNIELDYKKVYIDLDDTLIVKGEVNPWIVTFLYQSLNKEKEIHIISRHKQRFNEDTQEFLIAHKLASFSELVIDVPQDREKYEYIDANEAIFIDDSFSERNKVFKKLNIPVFDVSSIEALLDWRN
jgi:predicted ATP-grasp superfamily ATP-dependent carboligase